MTRRNLLLSPLAVALQRGSLEDAIRLLEQKTASGQVRSASLAVREAGFALDRAFGQARPATPFLLASITKPMTATAVMVLAARRQLRLEDPVTRFVPEFRGDGREAVTLHHVLTHTSGLPDMLPENEALRRRHAPLEEFVAATCRTPLLFRPGADVRYQSMGILMAAEVVQRITGQRLRDFLKREVFETLGMTSAALGLGAWRIEQTALCQVTADPDWNWNSAYWRDLGAPWGGAHASAADVARFLGYFLSPDARVLPAEIARSMVSNHTPGKKEPWGLAWMLKHSGRFGERCSQGTFGHYGSTGTVAWADPRTQRICVLLTTLPAADSRAGVLGPVSDVVSRAG